MLDRPSMNNSRRKHFGPWYPAALRSAGVRAQWAYSSRRTHSGARFPGLSSPLRGTPLLLRRVLLAALYHYSCGIATCLHGDESYESASLVWSDCGCHSAQFMHAVLDLHAMTLALESASQPSPSKYSGSCQGRAAWGSYRDRCRRVATRRSATS